MCHRRHQELNCRCQRNDNNDSLPEDEQCIDYLTIHTHFSEKWGLLAPHYLYAAVVSIGVRIAGTRGGLGVRGWAAAAGAGAGKGVAGTSGT